MKNIRKIICAFALCLAVLYVIPSFDAEAKTKKGDEVTVTLATFGDEIKYEDFTVVYEGKDDNGMYCYLMTYIEDGEEIQVVYITSEKKADSKGKFTGKVYTLSYVSKEYLISIGESLDDDENDYIIDTYTESNYLDGKLQDAVRCTYTPDYVITNVELAYVSKDVLYRSFGSYLEGFYWSEITKNDELWHIAYYNTLENLSQLNTYIKYFKKSANAVKKAAKDVSFKKLKKYFSKYENKLIHVEGTVFLDELMQYSDDLSYTYIGFTDEKGNCYYICIDGVQDVAEGEKRDFYFIADRIAYVVNDDGDKSYAVLGTGILFE